MKRFLIVFSAAAVVAGLSGCGHAKTYDGHDMQAFCIIGVILLLSIGLGAYTNMLRDEISDCDQFDEEVSKVQRRTKTKLLNKKSPFNLAKTQFAAWTVIIASSYIYLSLTKGDCAEGAINKTALVLMGIGTGILTAAAIIDKREMLDNRPRHQNRPSKGFFADILSDDNGVSIHRFQNFVWTAIAIIVYVMKVSHVQSGCVMPELSDTLLALTGISGVTFLTMRASENKPVAEDAPENAAAGNVVAPVSIPVDVVSTTTVSVSNNPVTGP
ncbi:hypothetical protein [Mucilaginibacter sp.]|uniref:hypothetical protein n=1 Tax=Mucilaginibacter sp. TaxID=1882438 RepID=UPI00261A2A18|nr:hypothetical protein [Mucilaginibacter sp.]MDB4920321.1 hypothetical protein [Mucilaginibacter sp.]